MFHKKYDFPQQSLITKKRDKVRKKIFNLKRIVYIISKHLWLCRTKKVLVHQ